MKIRMYFFVALAGLSFLGCKNNAGNSESEEVEVLPENIVEMNDEQYKMAGIVLGTAEDRFMGTTVKANGVVDVPPQNLVTISATMGGYVKSTSLFQGSPVLKGQVLAIVENAEFIELQQDYLDLKSQLEYAEAEYDRQKSLYNENVNSAKTYQQASSEYKSLKTKVAALAKKLLLIGIDPSNLKDENISQSVGIYSPISGYVKTVNINVGKYVNPTEAMFEIISHDNLLLELTLFEKDIEKVKIGQAVSFYALNNSSLQYTASIYQVGKSINDDNSFKAYATVGDDNTNLLSGMYISAIIETGNDTVKALPEEAVITFEDKSYVFIYSARRKEESKEVTDFEIIEVVKGVSEGGYIEVKFPADFDFEKSKIVIKGAYNLLAAKKNAGEMSC